jgi:SAM-dependent methyltransferase
MERQADVARSVASRLPVANPRVLDVGCGTGWLGNALLPYGTVWAVDLSPAAIAQGRRRHPNVQFICDDFLTAVLPGPFDLVLTADGLAHMPDHRVALRRMMSVVKPGGTLLLMTENPAVWRRRSRLRPLPPSVPHPRPEQWPSLSLIRETLRPAFQIERVSSLDPGGDRGLLWWVEHRYVRGAMNRLLGRNRWRALLERAMCGRELVILSTRTAAR